MADPKKPEDAKAPETRPAEVKPVVKAEPAFVADRPPDAAAPETTFAKEEDPQGRTFARASSGEETRKYLLAHPVGDHAKGEVITADRLIPIGDDWSDARIERAHRDGIERLIALGAIVEVPDDYKTAAQSAAESEEPAASRSTASTMDDAMARAQAAAEAKKRGA